MGIHDFFVEKIFIQPSFNLEQMGCVVSRIEWWRLGWDHNYDQDRRSYLRAIHRVSSEWMLPTPPMNFPENPKNDRGSGNRNKVF